MTTTNGASSAPGSSSGPPNRSVRFAEKNETRTIVPPQQRPPKRPRMERPNPDEEDDIDDWEENHDPEDEPTVSSKQLHQAKRARRLKRDGGEMIDEDDEDMNTTTQVGLGVGAEGKAVGEEVADATTSLLAEQNHPSQNQQEQNNHIGVNEIPVEPFNLDQERSDGSGYFVGDTYVFRKHDTEEEPDAWLESLDERTKEEAKNNTASSSSTPRRTFENDNNKDVSKGMDSWSRERLYEKLVSLMTNKETVLKALVRYGNLIKMEKKQQQKGMTNGGSSTNKTAGSVPSSRVQTSLDTLTEASNALLLKGDVDIYEKTKTDLLLAILPLKSPQEPTSMESNQGTTTAAANTPTIQWEYKGNQDGQIHGPFGTEQMKSWTEAGYFIGAQAVQIRTVKTLPASDSKKSNGDTKPSVDDLLSDIMDDDDDDDGGGGGDKDKNVQTQQHGEWQSSNDVNFSSFL